ncbi:flagellar protein FlaG [Tissierella praeacuta DSM 18095]|uniref:Flagellar protein FlaG n=1 Tax=Tissierella praeacuta DSM 18095 TaxID=1123404 RepID=A0A1M4X5C9_9FIRM|nr:flagellar protein FlaG [Tissierella praeacuta]TCU65774.1 flagellar protein FlaG [Tissierella praeacuta]SHE88718.1 flagellar protein FlaG [Tissierella praeacuta DSM 18095]SUO99740.1 flagellar protein FlaG [Tissierella praeacuta]
MQVGTVTNISSNSRIDQTQTIGTGSTEIKIPRQKLKNQDHRLEGQVEEKRLSEENVIGIIEKANKDFIAYDRRFEFSIHETTKQIMVKVIDVTTDEVIREIPPEKVLDMVAAIWEVAGIIVDKKI